LLVYGKPELLPYALVSDFELNDKDYNLNGFIDEAAKIVIGMI
jgi:hypothetical protein